MPLIQKQIKPKTEDVKVRIDHDLLATLDQYCKYLDDSDRNYVIAEAVKAVVSKDKDFRKWLEAQGPSERHERATNGVLG